MEIDHLLSTTRAVRRKLDLERPVEPEVLDECLNLALQAPTPGNVQAWRWLVVRDRKVKERLGALFRAVGATPRQVRRMITAEAFVLAVLAGLAGCVAGVLAGSRLLR